MRVLLHGLEAAEHLLAARRKALADLESATLALRRQYENAQLELSRARRLYAMGERRAFKATGR